MSHSYTLWDKAFQTLLNHVQSLSTLALQMVRTACEPAGDGDPIPELTRMEEQADRHHDAIRRRCATLVASTSPLAKDLRIVAGALHAATDLERIADESLDLAHALYHTPGPESSTARRVLSEMSSTVIRMVESSITAFLRSDLSKAEEVGRMDDEVDAAYLRLLYAEDALIFPLQRRDLVDGIVVAHALERIADHATNVAEWAVYLQTGGFVSLNGSAQKFVEPPT